jgi:hypothetical protein
MKRILMASTMLLALAWASILNAGVTSKTSPAAPALDPLQVTGTIANGGGTFAGTLSLIRFATQGGQLVAIGNLTGTLTDATGNTIGTITNQLVTLITTPGTATCEILNLTLGPLDLNLLGLMVHLDQVHLEITAQQAPGNLLGNLLCAVAHLLDSGGPLTGIAGLLNNILRVLGGV